MAFPQVFIDDSGDPGFRPYSSSHFVIAALIIENQHNLEQIAATMNTYKKRLGWPESREFKFNKTQKKHIKELLRLVSECHFDIYAVIINKKTVAQNTPALLYLTTIGILLREIPLKATYVSIDGHTGTSHQRKALSTIRQTANSAGRKIMKIRLVDSRCSPFIQLADLAAGALLRSTKTDKLDHQDFITIIKKHVHIIKI